MSLQELMRQRREKLARWRALGVEPYAYRFEPTHDAAGLLARGAAVTETPGETVRIAGRILTPAGTARPVSPISSTAVAVSSSTSGLSTWGRRSFRCRSTGARRRASRTAPRCTTT